VMKVRLLILFHCILSFSSSSFSQTTKDSSTANKTSLDPQISIGAGLNVIGFYDNSFFHDQAVRTYTPSSTAWPEYYLNQYSTNNVNLTNFRFSPFLSAPAAKLGYQFLAGRIGKWKLAHAVNLSYSRFSGNYSYIATYEQQNSNVITPMPWQATVVDSIRANYVQTVLSLGYCLQPSYKYFFFSLGMSCSLNLIKNNQQITEHVNGSWGNSYGYSYAIYPYSKSGSSSNSSKTSYINLPFQLGAGTYVNVLNISFKPGFYLTSCFLKGYNFYNFTLDILLHFNQKS
jgi:hypothetical protein